MLQTLRESQRHSHKSSPRAARYFFFHDNSAMRNGFFIFYYIKLKTKMLFLHFVSSFTKHFCRRECSSNFNDPRSAFKNLPTFHTSPRSSLWYHPRFLPVKIHAHLQTMSAFCYLHLISTQVPNIWDSDEQKCLRFVESCAHRCSRYPLSMIRFQCACILNYSVAATCCHCSRDG